MNAHEFIRESQLPALGATLAGRYRLRRFLGAGGAGAVYEAEEADGTRVAVKVLHCSTTESRRGVTARARFDREARVAAEIDSPFIVPVIDTGTDYELDMPFLVMPLLVGEDLDMLIERVGALHPVVAVRLVRQICTGLAAAHASCVIHRDVKPANIFLDHSHPNEVIARVLDFGIAKALGGRSLTSSGTVLGTPHYVAPEQWQSTRHVTAAADVWSLGATLYTALCGHEPFAEARTLTELALAVMSGTVPPLQQRAPWVQPGLAMIVHGTLMQEAERRCPDMAALSAALRPFAAEGENVTPEMLSRLTPELRNFRAVQAAVPSRWQHICRLAQPGTMELPAPPSDPLLGSTLAGRFTLLRRLGGGGMGAVYEATTGNGNRCAVKVIRPRSSAGSSAQRRLLREARAAMSLTNDHVLRVWEADIDKQRKLPFIVMELLTGQDLRAAIAQHGALEPAVVARLFIQACRGLAAAHHKRLVHRDIKPANMFLQALPSGEVRLKICDFGLVKQLPGEHEGVSESLTRTGGVIGSPGYMSPEQAKNARDVDPRTDIWSLGVSMFQALCGEHPWHRYDTVGELIVAICTEDAPLLYDKAPWLPPELVAVVHRAIRRNPAERFQSTDELQTSLMPFANGGSVVHRHDLRPVSDRRRASGYSAPPSSRRHSNNTAGALTQTVRRLGESPGRLTGLVVTGLACAALGITAASLHRDLNAKLAPASILMPDTLSSVQLAPAADALSPAQTAIFKIDGLVTVEPADADIKVDGRPPADYEDGKLQLSGEIGEPFHIVVTAGQHTKEKTVTIEKDGAHPERIDLELHPDAGKPPSAPTPDNMQKSAGSTAKLPWPPKESLDPCTDWNCK